MESEYIKKAIAWVLNVLGVLGVIAGLVGFFGLVVVDFNPWLLTITGLVILLSGYGTLNTDLDEKIR
jgi:hypothetical protein